jgi:hypothetical protein
VTETSEDELTNVQKVRLLFQYAPLLLRMSKVTTAKTPEARAAAAAGLLRWVSGRSETKADDEATKHVEAILNTPAGVAALDWLLKRLRGEA